MVPSYNDKQMKISRRYHVFPIFKVLSTNNNKIQQNSDKINKNKITIK